MRYTIALSLTSLLTTTAALAEVPRVVTDIPPVHALVAMVMGDLGEPALIMDRGGNAHDLQLRPSQAAAIAEAQLVVWTGATMAPWMDRSLSGLGGGVPRLTLLEVEGTYLQAFGAGDRHDHGDEHDDEHGDEHGEDHAKEAGHDDAHDHDDDHAKEAAEGDAHGHGDEHGEDQAKESGHDDAHDHDEDHAAEAAEDDDHAGHGHAGFDPHAWLDPQNAGHWLGVIAAELSRLDPQNAGAYAANAAAGAEAVKALDGEIATILEPIKGKPFVVFHDAYGYFTGHFGLTVAGAVRPGDASSPGAARLRELRAGLEGGNALCAFPEAGHDAALVEQMAEDTGVRLGGLLDPAGAALTPGAGLYADLMRGLAVTLADCLSES